MIKYNTKNTFVQRIHSMKLMLYVKFSGHIYFVISSTIQNANFALITNKQKRYDTQEHIASRMQNFIIYIFL